jgi:thiol:disulfide interchange protein DsbC
MRVKLLRPTIRLLVPGTVRAVGTRYVSQGDVMRSESAKRWRDFVVMAGALIAAMQVSHAGEAAVRRAVETLSPGARIESIARSPVKGLYEVYVDGEILYVEETGRTALHGSLLDVASKANLTQARKDKLLSVLFSELPLELAIKTVKGNGQRVFAAFEDPNCGYCKQLHATLKTVDDYTLYTFLVPILGPDSEAKVRTIWCADDRAAALSSTLQGAQLTGSAPCDVPMDQLVRLAQKLRVQGTPTLIFTDGTRINGMLPADRFVLRLSASTVVASAKPAVAR